MLQQGCVKQNLTLLKKIRYYYFFLILMLLNLF